MTGYEHIIFLWSKPHLRDNIMKKFFIQSIAPQTRLAGIDCTQWFKQGLTEEFIGLEEKIDKFSEKNKISCICGYDINKIPDKKILKKVIKSHGYVMLDNPHMLFKSGI